MELIIHTDGGARGNPGPAAIGVVIEAFNGKALRDDELHNTCHKKIVLAEFGKRIGEASNNVAEYTGVIEALETVISFQKNAALKHVTRISFYLDSTLVVNQLNGIFTIKSAHLRPLLVKIRQLEQEIGLPVAYTAVRRVFNFRADYFVNAALNA